MVKKLDRKLKKLAKSRDFWLVIAILVFGFWSGFFQGFFESSPPIARLEIDFGASRRAFEGEVRLEDMSVLDALLASSRAGSFEVYYSIINDQTEILKINGTAEDGLNEKAWNFYLNGQKIETSEIHKTEIKASDKILVKFE